MPCPEILEIAAEMRAESTSPHAWEICSNQAGAVQGEAGGAFVGHSNSRFRGYLKPIRPGLNAEQKRYAAREKICSDLAQDLNLPVPPASLVNWQPEGQLERLPSVVTLVQYPTQHSWRLLQTHIEDQDEVGLAVLNEIRLCSGLFAFDQWVEQIDHNDHPHNVVWGYDNEDEEDSGLVFLDYALTLGQNSRWRHGGWNRTEVVGFPRVALENLKSEILTQTINEIEEFPEAVIRDIVMRVPDEFLPELEKNTLIDGLIGRRSIVRLSLRDFIGE